MRPGLWKGVYRLLVWIAYKLELSPSLYLRTLSTAVIWRAFALQNWAHNVFAAVHCEEKQSKSSSWVCFERYAWLAVIIWASFDCFLVYEYNRQADTLIVKSLINTKVPTVYNSCFRFSERITRLSYLMYDIDQIIWWRWFGRKTPVWTIEFRLFSWSPYLGVLFLNID